MTQHTIDTSNPEVEPPHLETPAATARDIESFIASAVTDTECDGVVVNLSGGIDSTVTARLAVDALGPESVYGLILPSEATPATDVTDAQNLAHDLGIDFRTIDIDPMLTTFTRTAATKHRTVSWPDPLSRSQTRTIVVDPIQSRDRYREALGNVTARIRMLTAYFEANTTNRLVLGTGNRTELLLGYFTKHGDGGVDLLPLGDLYKTQVRDVARHLGVGDHILEKPPSAGLWPGQTDEDELGATYATIDAILHRMVDMDRDLDRIIAELDVPATVVEHVGELRDTTSHKRSQPPTPEIDPADV